MNVSLYIMGDYDILNDLVYDGARRPCGTTPALLSVRTVRVPPRTGGCVPRGGVGATPAACTPGIRHQTLTG